MVKVQERDHEDANRVGEPVEESDEEDANRVGEPVEESNEEDTNLVEEPVEESDEEDPNKFTNCEICGLCYFDFYDLWERKQLLLCDGCDRGFHYECLRETLAWSKWSKIEVTLYRSIGCLWFCNACKDTRSMQLEQQRNVRLRPVTRRKRQKMSLRSRRKADKKKALALAKANDPKTRILKRMLDVENERREETRPSMSSATQTSILAEQTFGKDRAEAAKYHKGPFERLKVEDSWFNSESIFYEVEVKDRDSLSLSTEPDFNMPPLKKTQSTKSAPIKPGCFLESILESQTKLLSKQISNPLARETEKPSTSVAAESNGLNSKLPVGFKIYEHLKKKPDSREESQVKVEPQMHRDHKIRSNDHKHHHHHHHHHNHNHNHIKSINGSSGNDRIEKANQLPSFDLEKCIVKAAKRAIKPYYASRRINKDEYKMIMKKVVTKVLHECRPLGDFNQLKLTKLVDAYVVKTRTEKVEQPTRSAASISAH